MPEIWKPHLAEGSEPAYKRLISALQSDIEQNVVSAGTKLPPVRETAFQLKLSAGTIARAYRDAEHLGLTTATVGRGTFIAGDAGRNSTEFAQIDLSQNLPPIMLSGSAVARAATSFREPSPEMRRYSYGPHNGFPAQRAQFADIARARLPEFRTDNLIITNGGQHGIYLSLSAVCEPGDVVLCENLTFNGVKAAAEMLKIKLVGVPMDEEGMIPAALAEAAQATGAKAVYMIPTGQNPTGRIQSPARRQELARICEESDLIILEADMYAFMLDEPPLPLAHYAPERTFYIDSFSKRLSPSLRTGMLVCPAHLLAKTQSIFRATSWMSSPLTAAITAQMHQDGVAIDLAEKIRQETEARARIAGHYLHLPTITPHALQIWLDMPMEYAIRTELRAHDLGVTVTPMQVPGVPGHDGAPPPTGLRICLGGPETRTELAEGLKRLVKAMEPAPHDILSLI